MKDAGRKSDYKLTKNTPCLTLTGELWSVFCEYHHVIKTFHCINCSSVWSRRKTALMVYVVIIVYLHWLVVAWLLFKVFLYSNLFSHFFEEPSRDSTPKPEPRPSSRQDIRVETKHSDMRTERRSDSHLERPAENRERLKPAKRRWSTESVEAKAVTSTKPAKQQRRVPAYEAEGETMSLQNWKLFLCYWPFVRGIHRWPVDSPHKGASNVDLPCFHCCLPDQAVEQSPCQ